MTWMNINIIIIAFYLVFFMFGKRVATMQNIKQFQMGEIGLSFFGVLFSIWGVSIMFGE